MYWPAGAPKIYEQVVPEDDDLPVSHDGIIEEELEEGEAQGASLKDEGSIISLCVSRTGHLFATLSRTTLTIWNTKPPLVLASVIRSKTSLKTYGPNLALLMRPDAVVLVIRTANGFLITYSLTRDSEDPACELVVTGNGRRHLRRRSIQQQNGSIGQDNNSSYDGGGPVQSASLRFRMVIRVDAGISQALALDEDIVIATVQPPAVQSIRWQPDRSGSQTNTELFSSMKWLHTGASMIDLVYEKPMSTFVFVMSDGKAYAVQRTLSENSASSSSGKLFRGFLFHAPATPAEKALKAVINSRFSTIALGQADGSISLYTIRDHVGGISRLRRIEPSCALTSCGEITSLSYSADGHCLLATYQTGFMSWSAFGQPGATSFGSDTDWSRAHEEKWLVEPHAAAWIGSSSDVLITCGNSKNLWLLEFARSAITSCFNQANIAKALLQTTTGFMVYQGHQSSNLTTIAGDISLWQHIQVPSHYLRDQWPARGAVISQDGRYLAVAGQRGLAHFSLQSGRWKTFEDMAMQNDFVVRGGMFWHHHILIAAVECHVGPEIRLYSRELPLDNTRILHTESLAAPAVHIAPANDDSILVYTSANVLDHYIIAATKKSVKLVKVGQIMLGGILRAPARVRSVSWVVPEYQIQHGNPSKDVTVASIFFLVDGKLVLLQPSATEVGELKYDMRVVADHVEYYILSRDSPTSFARPESSAGPPRVEESNMDEAFDHSLRDSLWVFDGQKVKVWPDVNELLRTSSPEVDADLQSSIDIELDFYPLAPLLHKGIIFGVEAELVQRKEPDFAFFRILARTTLFLPDILRHHLSQFDSPAALHLSHHFKHLPYFAHALEVLLHNVLDDEAEQPPESDDVSVLPPVLSFLSSFPEYLDIIVQCTRKTELRSWRTLFQHLPPPSELFEASLRNGWLKTAGGYLLVLHTLAEIGGDSPQVVRLLRAAKDAQDWELCKELARFLVALDPSGNTLREALRLSELQSSTAPSRNDDMHRLTNGTATAIVQSLDGLAETGTEKTVSSPEDYFSPFSQARE